MRYTYMVNTTSRASEMFSRSRFCSVRLGVACSCGGLNGCVWDGIGMDRDMIDAFITREMQKKDALFPHLQARIIVGWNLVEVLVTVAR